MNEDLHQALKKRVKGEVRFDRALTGTRPFNDSKDRNQFTAGIDVIIGF